MNFSQGALDWAPAFALVLARVGAAMALLPGVGEAVAPAIVRIGLALSITILLMPELQPMIPPVPAAGLTWGLMIGSEVITGLWFGWVARMIVLALPTGAQFIGYFIGLSSVLQPDAELGAQSGALGKLFEMAAPVILLVTGLVQASAYRARWVVSVDPAWPYSTARGGCRNRRSSRWDRVQPSLPTRVAVRRDRGSLACRDGAGRSDCITHADLLHFYAWTDRIGPSVADGYSECHDLRVE